MNVIRTISSLLVATSLLACSRHDPTAPSPARVDNLGSLNGARVELAEEGGIAALSTTYSVRHDDRAFSFSRRHICAATCPAPLDSASGTLSVAAADSLFNVVSRAQPTTLKDDYGTTPNSADMVTYTLRVVLGNETKTVRADDGTMPSAMRNIVDALHRVVAH
ncbi:MAG TPA: protealysin inhibitor emfourin [Gemmatimonadaceae bacterium]